MFRGSVLAGFLLSLSFILLADKSFSQPALPDMAAVTQKGLNIISWTAQYEGIKSIAVQRSADSTYNYATIGYVKNLKKGPQAFIDGHPLPGKNWYRLYIIFNSDLTWYSNRIKLFVDSSQLLQQTITVSSDSLQKLASRVKFVDTTGSAAAAAAATATTGAPAPPPGPVLELSIPDISTVDAYTYLKSQYVFTNPFTGHVNVELEDAPAVTYSLVFYDGKTTTRPVLRIARIPKSSVILDKRNFQHKGIYRFDLMKGEEKVESGYITIY